MGKLSIVLILAVLCFVIGTSDEVHAFFVKNSRADVVVEQKTIPNPSPQLEAHTEPLTASSNIVQEPAPTPPPAPTPVPPVNNEAIVWNRLIAEGFSREQTAGIMGNLQQEHNFQTDGDGLAQWTQGRLANLLARPNHRDINVQLDYMMEELNGGYSHVKQEVLVSGLDGALLAFQNKYEKCGICMEEKRFMYAYQILGKY